MTGTPTPTASASGSSTATPSATASATMTASTTPLPTRQAAAEPLFGMQYVIDTIAGTGVPGRDLGVLNALEARLHTPGHPVVDVEMQRLWVGSTNAHVVHEISLVNGTSRIVAGMGIFSPLRDN
ncbi:MAG: hypothetical protein EOO65_03470, partial [Methanosarcinales archaeon]